MRQRRNQRDFCWLFRIRSRITTAVEIVKTVSTELNGVSETLRSAWESYQGRFEDIDEDLERAFTKLHEGIGHHQHHVQDFVRKLDESFEKALNGLSDFTIDLWMNTTDNDAGILSGANFSQDNEFLLHEFGPLPQVSLR